MLMWEITPEDGEELSHRWFKCHVGFYNVKISAESASVYHLTDL